jgi:2-C-methyl-D-erythritol 2,4-cyclodiphosphate synthase
LRQLPGLRIGIGFDAHAFTEDRRLVLGGVVIPDSPGLAGHSDADVLLHALMDAILGAAALPDIGTLFPDTDAAYRDADSTELLKQVRRRATRAGYRIVNVDCVLVCDKPRLIPHVAAIRTNLARLLRIPEDCVGLKAKTTEGTRLAIPGRSIAAMVTSLLLKHL